VISVAAFCSVLLTCQVIMSRCVLFEDAEVLLELHSRSMASQQALNTTSYVHVLYRRVNEWFAQVSLRFEIVVAKPLCYAPGVYFIEDLKQ